MIKLSVEGFRYDLKTSTGIQYSLLTRKRSGSFYAVEMPKELEFQIEKETSFHRGLRAIGFKGEPQSNDINFDSEYYIGCDDKYFNKILVDDNQCRELIHLIFKYSEYIEQLNCRENALFVKCRGNIENIDVLIDLLHQLKVRICLGFESLGNKVTLNPSSTLAFIFDCSFLGLFTLSVEFLFEVLLQNGQQYASHLGLFFYGSILGVIVTAIGLFLLSKVFFHSARMLQSVKQNFGFIIISCIFWGTKMFVVANHSFDTSEVMTKDITITKKQIITRQSVGRYSGGPYKVCQWYYKEPREQYARVLELAPKVCESANEGDRIAIKTRNGFFNYPYRISINNIEL
ncbi:MAG: hypothetical protein NDI63_11370 [Pseudobdellovibrio sp.]|nr:hypothetical protein [Pseudobdellovibrio sp.]